MTLKSFPRGGKKPDKKPSFHLPHVKKQKFKLKKKKEVIKIPNESTQENSFEANTAQDLRHSSLYIGMVILGRIYKVSEYDAIVSLPGQLSGKLKATDISETYTNLLKDIAKNNLVSDDFKSLPEMYKVGDYVVCYIKDLSDESISLSLEPQLINEKLNPKILSKRSKVTLAVSSIEDHGYVMETGSKNFRAFLSKKDVENEDLKFYPGKQIICAVKDIKLSENTYTAKVSVKVKHLSSIESEILSLDCMIPGSQVSLVVKSILPNGIKVFYGNQNIGFINQIYLQKPAKTFSEDEEVIGTFLYMIPTVKFSYFSLLSTEDNQSLKAGDVIEKAKVLARESRGILMKLKKGVRGFIPLKRTGIDFKNIKSIFLQDTTHKCRIIAYDLMQKLYICTMEKKLLEEKSFNKKHKIGDIVEATVKNIQSDGAVNVNIGTVNAVIPPLLVEDPGSNNKLKPDQKIQTRVLNFAPGIKLTSKKSLIDSKYPILFDKKHAKVNSIHDGTVVLIKQNSGVLVLFYGDVKGWIPSLFLKGNSKENWNLVVGQTVTTVIKKVDLKENKITLAIFNENKLSKTNYQIGDIVKGIVIDSTSEGIQLKIKDKDEEYTGFLPAEHMSPCQKIGKLLAAKTVPGDELNAFIFSTQPNLILSTTFTPEKIYMINDLHVGDCLMCSVKDTTEDLLNLIVPVKDYSNNGIVSIGDSSNFSLIRKNQILFGKVIGINKRYRKITMTTQLDKIWKSIPDSEAKMTTAIDLLSSYLSKMNDLSKYIYYSSKPISKLKLGQKVTGTVETVLDKFIVLKLENDIKGIVNENHFTKIYNVGDKVTGTVMWVNYPEEYLNITLLNNYVTNIQENQESSLSVGTLLRADILLVTDWFVLIVLKGVAKGILAALPVRRHLNDFSPNLSLYKVGARVRCYAVLNADEADTILPLCYLKSACEERLDKFIVVERPEKIKRKASEIFDLREIINQKKLKSNKKENFEVKKINQKDSQKNSEKKEKKDVNDDPESFVNNQVTFKEKVIESKSKVDSCSNKSSLSQDESLNSSNKDEKPITALPECGFIWDNKPSEDCIEESSSDSEEESTDNLKIKKKKLTPAEKREVERQKEREIREKEESLAASGIPQTVDQFDRLVLSSPNSSLVWVQYMAYHLQAAEVDKARSVAKRAVKTINFREEDEKLNVWQAWLNLESRFGTPESVNDVFQEAIKFNDAEKIFSHMLTVHYEAGRQTELEKVVSTMIAKFKQNFSTYINCGDALLKAGLKDKSRQIMQRGLQSLPANKHVDLIVRFAQFENKFGDKERSQTLFEQILSSYPKRTDVWSSYVDTLVKSDEIDLARKVLERATTQGLPAKKMKTIFKKFINFEEKYGTPENVSRIQELAVKYVEEQCNKNVV